MSEEHLHSRASVRYQFVGLVVRIVGLALFLAYVLEIGPYPGLLPGALPDLAILLTLILMPLSVFLRYRGRQYAAMAAQNELSLDLRAPVVYLRSFSEEERQPRRRRKQLFWGGLVELALTDLRSLEERLALVLRRVGPVVAITRPGASLPELGATWVYPEDGAWQSTVIDLISRAVLVVVKLGPGPGLAWEVQHITSSLYPTKLLLLLPSDASAYAEVQELSRSLFPKALPQVRPRSLLVMFDTDWTPVPLPPPGVLEFHRDSTSRLLRVLDPYLRQNELSLG